MKTTVESEILEVLRTVVGAAKEPVPLHAPEFAQGERALVMDCIDSSFVLSAGKYVIQFEDMLSEFTGARRAVAVVNGTAALEVALRVAGVCAGDEVIVPALSFVATANAVTHCGAIPHFVDSDANTLGIDPLALEDYLGSIGKVSFGCAGSCSIHANSRGSPELGEPAPRFPNSAIHYMNGAICVFSEYCVKAQAPPGKSLACCL
jgi:perosamine synthetase